MRARGLGAAVLFLLVAPPARADVANGGFETGDFAGWTADSNWVVVDNSCGYYSGWSGKYWAWSGGKGEPATGVLKSDTFVLDKQAVHLLISGWASVQGSGLPRRWNYVTLNLEDGTEIDRVYAPDTTAFVPVWLDGSGHKGQRVYIKAVDDADQPTYSMLCVDDVRTADLPGDYARRVAYPQRFDPRRSLLLEDGNCLVEVSRANGSITRIRDEVSGLDLILEPRLAGSYRFALPIPGKEPWQTIEANWIVGREQKLSTFRQEGGKLTLYWDAPLRNYLGEEFDASVAMTIELRDGGILFSLSIDNPTPYPVGETYFPILGGIQGLGETNGQLIATRMVRPVAAATAEAAATHTSADVFRVFGNMSPFGDQGPEQFYAYPASQPEPWVGFSCPKTGRSALVCAIDPTDRSLVARLELVPASSGTTRDDGNWPRPEELRGQPIGVELSFVDTAGGRAGRTYRAAPVFLRFLDGEGPAMSKEYGERKAEKLSSARS